ncbi:uncharacterized protein TRIREDRAFT_103048 [Trichoderma reesei QM6a]|uniref:Predicted protein n=2 Tax=Hypocrea jecorina TaxID=51453 RepID=G0R948_HYPJQ|nr:uncharacterized protein TRIREDRAFT_103048 [Trichoderma reesei QM6a]EGR52434.1 predicted protein [Trichoderma reesei QM6a]ETR98399.1 hypothetical protein M419DRAFT_88912 [Trichoderma reesei RUT C-30]
MESYLPTEGEAFSPIPAELVPIIHTCLDLLQHTLSDSTTSKWQSDHISMDEERRSKIAIALQQYRQTVSQHNFALLRILQPRDIFNDDVRNDIIQWAGLDGVSNGPINLRLREEYFASVRAEIAEKNIDVVEFPPADLECLCTLVDGITGPGLPYYCFANMIEFITPTGDSGVGGLKGSVIFPAWNDAGDRVDALSEVWETWEIAVAFVTGGGPFDLCGSCAIYCSSKEDDGNKEWKWRYGIFDGGWGSDIYNSVEEFLGFYAHFEEQTEEMFRKDVVRMGLVR